VAFVLIWGTRAIIAETFVVAAPFPASALPCVKKYPNDLMAEKLWLFASRHQPK
jgi:hypothetical protein